MTSAARAFVEGVRWELLRLRRSRRLALFLIPPVAGPIGTALAWRLLAVPNPGTAEVLGLFVTAGLAALVALDLGALAAGEDLAVHADRLEFALPQSPRAATAGRLLPPIGGAVAADLAGAAAIVAAAPRLVPTGGAGTPVLLDPTHLLWGLVGFLLLLGGVAAAAATTTRSPAQGLVAGVLAGVVAAGISAEFLVQGTLSAATPIAMALGGLVAIALAVGGSGARGH